MLSMHPACQIDGNDIPEPSKLLDVDPEVITKELNQAVPMRKPLST